VDDCEYDDEYGSSTDQVEIELISEATDALDTDPTGDIARGELESVVRVRDRGGGGVRGSNGGTASTAFCTAMPYSKHSSES
jgi:hypothetical protein